jgi:hypothetical protein
MEPLLHPPEPLAASGWSVLILRDVLGWPPAEVALLLGLGEAAVEAELARARARVPDDEPGERERVALARLIGTADPGGVSLVRALLREHAAAA